MRFLVAGAGAWGTAFTHVLRERGHDVVLACHTREQADAINETGRNPRSLPKVDLRGVEAVPLDKAPADVEVVVVAVPSKAFAAVVRRSTGHGSGAQPHERSRPGNGRASVDARAEPPRSRFSPGRTWRRRSRSDCRRPR